MIWLCSQPDPEHRYWREEAKNGLRDRWGSPGQEDLPGQPQEGGHRNTGRRQPAPSWSVQHCWGLEVRWGVGSVWGAALRTPPPPPAAPCLGLLAAGPGSSCTRPSACHVCFCRGCLPGPGPPSAERPLESPPSWEARCHRRSAQRGTESELEMGSHRRPRYSRPSETWRALPRASYPHPGLRPTL